MPGLRRETPPVQPYPASVARSPHCPCTDIHNSEKRPLQERISLISHPWGRSFSVVFFLLYSRFSLCSLRCSLFSFCPLLVIGCEEVECCQNPTCLSKSQRRVFKNGLTSGLSRNGPQAYIRAQFPRGSLPVRVTSGEDHFRRGSFPGVPVSSSGPLRSGKTTSLRIPWSTAP